MGSKHGSLDLLKPSFSINILLFSILKNAEVINKTPAFYIPNIKIIN